MSNTPTFREVQRRDLDVMLAHIVRLPEVLSMASAFLKLDDFDPVTEKGHRLVFSVVKEFYQVHRGVMPPYDIVIAEIQKRVQGGQVPGFSDPQILMGLYNFVHWCFSYPAKDLIPAYVQEVMNDLVFQRRVVPKVIDAAEQGSVTPDMIGKLAMEVQTQQIQRGQILTPFAEDVDMFGVQPRTPTGVTFLDNIMGGGTRPKEVYGMIAPSGGGKTTLTNQIFINLAAQGRHCAIFQYEESPADNDFMTTVYACAARIDRSVIESVTHPSQLPDKEREAYYKAKAKISNYLHFIDMSGQTGTAGRGGISEIDATLTMFQNRGVHLDAIAVDWFLPMAQRCFTPDRFGKGSDMRHHFQDLIDQLKMLAGRHKLWCWVAHQTAPAEVNKKKSSSWTDAAEFKSMAWLMHCFFAMGQMDEHNIGELVMSKGRKQKRNQKLFLHLVGEYATFEAVGSDMKWDPRKKTYIKEGTERKIPTDRPVGGSSLPDGASRKISNMEATETC